MATGVTSSSSGTKLCRHGHGVRDGDLSEGRRQEGEDVALFRARAIHLQVDRIDRDELLPIGLDSANVSSGQRKESVVPALADGASGHGPRASISDGPPSLASRPRARFLREGDTLMRTGRAHHADVGSRVEFRPSLSQDDVTRKRQLRIQQRAGGCTNRGKTSASSSGWQSTCSQRDARNPFLDNPALTSLPYILKPRNLGCESRPF